MPVEQGTHPLPCHLTEPLGAPSPISVAHCANKKKKKKTSLGWASSVAEHLGPSFPTLPFLLFGVNNSLTNLEI